MKPKIMKAKTMKPIEAITVIAIIFIALACRCQSDLFKSKKRGLQSPTPYSTPYPATSSSPYGTPTPAALYGTPDATPYGRNMSNGSGGSTAAARLSTGSYTGSGLNTTYNKPGDFLLRIDTVEANGVVKGYFEASNGLSGNGPLSGGVDANGKIGLFGKMADGKGLIISAQATGDTIRGNYIIGNKQSGIQKGEFTVSK